MNTATRFVLVALAPLLVLLTAARGCDDTTREYRVQQPMSFNHKVHVDYFKGGKHRASYLETHIKALELDEEEAGSLVLTACKLCHQRGQKPRCDGCHNPLFQDMKLFARKDIRVCVGCHRGAWGRNLAAIPTASVCRDCHATGSPPRSPAEEDLRQYLGEHADIPWVQLHRVAPHVHFSHSAHVRFGEMSCTECHEDMGQRVAPPTRASLLSMNACIRCHEDNRVSTDCLVCHK